MKHFPVIFIFLIILSSAILLVVQSAEAAAKKKKDIRDFTDADIEKLYDEWEENDEDELEEDEKPGYIPKRSQHEFDSMIKNVSYIIISRELRGFDIYSKSKNSSAF